MSGNTTGYIADIGPLRKLLPPALHKTLGEQAQNLPWRYFKSTDPKGVEIDLPLIDRLKNEPLILEVTGMPPVIHILLRKEQPKMFLRIIGALATENAQIDKASVFMGLKDRMVLSHIEFGPTVQSDAAGAVAQKIKRSLETGEVFTPKLNAPDKTGLTIKINNEVSTTTTVVTILGRDQPGFLYRVASVFADLDLTLMTADIVTFKEKVMDSFNLVNANGEKLTAGQCQALQTRLTAAFEA
jgi:UTP:GlnB (protein PII) uridylyltransferase